mmetsp:Transcript_6668/g.11799  ORF Transcript_6668/g.11799 Transcript_6668/m.11799 type:complete len:854 (+) Transcript_6668:3905-6466(+)
MRPRLYKGPVTALLLEDSDVLAGTGRTIKRYRASQVVSQHTCTHSVYGIRQGPVVGAFGVQALSLISLDLEQSLVCAELADRILDVRLATEVVVSFAHNFVQSYTYSLEPLLRVECPIHCILYSSQLADCSSLLVAAGTVFKAVIVWTDEDYYMLHGHNGVIFNVSFGYDNTRLLSASDDRTVRVWDLVSRNCTGVLKGHTARVWASSFIESHDLIVSIAEDATVRIWKGEECISIMEGHSGKNIWSLAVNSYKIVTGGADGSIRHWCVPPAANRRLSFTHKSWDVLKKKDYIRCLTWADPGIVIGTQSGAIWFLDESLDASIEYQADGPVNALASKDGTIVYATKLSVGSFKPLTLQTHSPSRVYSLILTVDLVCAYSADGFVRAYNLSDMSIVYEHFLSCSDTLGSLPHLDAVCCAKEDGKFFLFDKSACTEHRLGIGRLTFASAKGATIYCSNEANLVYAVKVEGQEVSLQSTIRGLPDLFDIEAGYLFCFRSQEVSIWESASEVARLPWKSCKRPYLLKADGGHLKFIQVNVGVVDVFESSAIEAFREDKELHIETGFPGKEILCATAFIENGHLFVLTGSEDSSLKAFRVDGESLVLQESKHDHPSAIRALAMLDGFLVSGGGKSFLAAWHVRVDRNALLIDKQTHLVLKRPIDQRINALQVSRTSVYVGDSGGFLVKFTRTSAALVEAESINLNGGSILALKLFENQVLAGTSSGLVVSAHSDTLHVLRSFSVHCAGTNCIDVISNLPDPLLLSGGDDQVVRLSCLMHESEIPGSSAINHTSGVKGVGSLNSNIYTVGYDQRLHCLSLELEKKSSLMTSVTDTCALTIAGNYCVVVGAGLEIFELDS